ncbi:uncharacterized protein PG998_005998 [Apiospora kogelbergensis]|uniref:uncharacterized protein n=1 Tax=Apiospora kogelbergensis TaxID=1337665 RepID=UPI00312D48B4
MPSPSVCASHHVRHQPQQQQQPDTTYPGISQAKRNRASQYHYSNRNLNNVSGRGLTDTPRDPDPPCFLSQGNPQLGHQSNTYDATYTRPQPMSEPSSLRRKMHDWHARMKGKTARSKGDKPEQPATSESIARKSPGLFAEELASPSPFGDRYYLARRPHDANPPNKDMDKKRSKQEKKDTKQVKVDGKEDTKGKGRKGGQSEN